MQLGTKRNYKVVEEKLLGFVLVYKLACTELHGSDSLVKCVSRFCVKIRLCESSIITDSSNSQTTQQPIAVGNNSRNRNSIFHSFGMWRGGGVYCRLTRQWLYLHRWFLKKYFLQIHFSYFFAFFFLLLGIAKISDTMI